MIAFPRTAVGAALLVLASLPAQATVHFFTASLASLGEPVPTSTATGSATFAFDDVALSVLVNETYAGIASNPSGNHIHCCTATAGTGSTGVALNFSPLATGTSASYTNTFTLSSAAFSSLLAGATAGKAYVNIHTPGTYAAGEIRGFLVSAVPEPETYALMLAGLGVLVLRRSRIDR
ncbi:MAG: CHRD domain-containing protein [Burkholderiales bacterium]|nr:CHRD domain-containing protein [Burkholderiales bacterium]